MKTFTANWIVSIAAVGGVVALAAMPAVAAPAQSFGNLKPAMSENAGGLLEVVRHRRWHRHHCHWTKRCWHHRGHRHCNWVRRCW
jgi:hypothetical protein